MPRQHLHNFVNFLRSAPVESQPQRIAFFCVVMFTMSSLLVTAGGMAALTSDDVRLGKKIILKHEAKQTSGPMLQIDAGGIAHLTWIEEMNNDRPVYYVQSSLQAEALPKPVRVNPHNQPAASLHEPPALALGHAGEVYVTWTAPHPKSNGKPFASILQLSRSANRGQTFESPVQVNDDDAVTGHSFDHVTVAPNGVVHLSWIDAREGKKDPATFVAQSDNRGASVTKNIKVDENTCVCCRTTIATSHDGIIYVAWRKIFPGNIRETVIARSLDGGQTFSPPIIVGNDRWAFPGCPHRPASVGIDGQGRVYVVWYTEGPDDTPGIYLATSDDQGQTFSPRRQLNISKGTFPDHPQMAVDRMGRVLVVWEEQSPARREVVFSYSLSRGAHFSSPQRLNEQKAEHPTVAMNANGEAAIAWLERVEFPNFSTILQSVHFADGSGLSHESP